MKTEDLQCALTGKSLVIGEAVFLTISPDAVLLVDLNKELPGKHICLECKKEVVERAIKQGILQDVFGVDIQIPTGFAEKILLRLHKKAYDMLCMAKKSGALVHGLEKVMTALKADKCDFILQASDGTEGGKQKAGLNSWNLRIFSVFTSAELGRVTGKEKVVHMAVLKNNANMSASLSALMARIENF